MNGLRKFQTDRGLQLNKYLAIDAHANIIEELMESIGLDITKEKRGQLKDKLLRFVKELKEEGIAVQKYEASYSTPIEEKVDAYADVIVFAHGEIMKLGYEPEQVLEQVSMEINSRVGTFVNGKFEKDLSPEAKENWLKADFRGCKLHV